MSSGAKPSFATGGFSDDQVLVRECLLGSERAWSQLIDKYKNLIYSIPIKYGLSKDDAADIFQSVSFSLLGDLAQLREPKALPAWLIRLTARKCIRWKHETQMHGEVEFDENLLNELATPPPEMIEQIEREQMFRQALSETTPECARLIELLFFTDPPVSYDTAAQTLGMAKGSMGATRMRCLDKLRRALEKKGVI